MRSTLYAMCLLMSVPISASFNEIAREALLDAAQEALGLSAPSNSSMMAPWNEGTFATSGSRSRDNDRNGGGGGGLCCCFFLIYLMAQNNNNARYR